MTIQFTFLISLVFSFLLQTSIAATTSFTQVLVEHVVFEFEMEYGGTHVENLYDVYGIESFSIVYSDNESINCFLRGYKSTDGMRSAISPTSRYGSPVQMSHRFQPRYLQLVCYDISDSPNTAVLFLYRGDPMEATEANSLDALYKLPLDENREGVVLLPADKQDLTLATLVESPYERLWCKAGDTYEDEDTLGYGGVELLHWINLSAIPCTTQPRPRPEEISNQRNGLAMDRHFQQLIEAKEGESQT